MQVMIERQVLKFFLWTFITEHWGVVVVILSRQRRFRPLIGSTSPKRAHAGRGHLSSAHTRRTGGSVQGQPYRLSQL
jgi:hypothetical protein